MIANRYLTVRKWHPDFRPSFHQAFEFVARQLSSSYSSFSYGTYAQVHLNSYGLVTLFSCRLVIHRSHDEVGPLSPSIYPPGKGNY